MMKRSLFAVVMASAALLVRGGHAPAQGGPRPTVTITAANLSPSRLPGTGGRVTVNAKVKAVGGASINSVTARATVTGVSAGGVATLTDTGGGNYTGSVNVPANSGRQSTTADVTITVSSSVGTKTKRLSVKLDPGNGDPSQPPPPPPI